MCDAVKCGPACGNHRDNGWHPDSTGTSLGARRPALPRGGLIAVCSSENNQIDPFRKEIGSCHFPVPYSSMAFNYTLNKNQRPFPDLVFDCRFDLIFYYSFPCSLCFNHPFLHMCWHIPIFGPLFCCFLCLEFCPHRYSYGPMFISFRSLLRW